jgi:thiol-disulfide isomerase/thioredoxin
MILKLLSILCLISLTARADERLPLLTIKGETYSNVTVTAVTATDVYFTHANGMGNAKLKDLDPALQAHFHYNAAKSALMEKQFATNNVIYHKYLLSVKSAEDDFVAPKLYARSLRGKTLPPFPIEQWLTPPPDATDKFILIEYWKTASEPCRRTIPQLNAFFEKYHDRLAIIGLTDEPEATVRMMTYPQIEYAVAIDTQARMRKALAITAIPHCILIDPHGIVRYEGPPSYLDEPKLEHFLVKYQ